MIGQNETAAAAEAPEDAAPGSHLAVRDLVVKYGGVNALAGVSIDVGPGEAVALVGPNGAGKTTLLRAISGAVAPASGSIRLRGVEISTLRPDQLVRRGLCHVLEGRHLFGAMTVEENLRVGGTSRRAAADVTTEMAMIYEHFPIIAAKRTARAESLSGGQQQLVAIARALLARPTVLLLDEPSLGLAPIMLESVSTIISWARDTYGMSVLIVEQHTSLAFAVAARAYVLIRGGVAVSAPTEQLAIGGALEEIYMGAGLGDDPAAVVR